MSLSAEEYREHLATTAVRAGFDFRDVVLPGEGDIRIGGLQMHYLDWGSKGKPPILFLHGGALTAHTWDLCCLALRDDFHCLAVDQRGHGDTDWAPDGDYSIAAQVGDVRGFIDHIGLQDFVLVGMSMGAINALAYAINHSDRLSHLVIIDAGPEMRRPGSSRIRDFVNDVADAVSIEAIIERALAIQPAPRPEHPAAQPDAQSAAAGGRELALEIRPQPVSAAAPGDASRRAGALADGLSAIACPTLVVRGGESDVFHDEDAERLASRLPNARWVKIPGAGHTVQGDNPKGLVAELRGFLAKGN